MTRGERKVRGSSILSGLGCALGLFGAAHAQGPVAPSPAAPSSPPAAIAVSQDQAERMTVPVMIDGHGPFAFVIDTGADRTVISRELAATLGLPPGAPVAVHATSGVAREQTAVMDALQVGGRLIHRIEAPLLSRADLGADGMLGIDCLRNQTMIMDFKGRQLMVKTYDDQADSPGAIVVRAKNRYGELILVDASVGGVPVYVIVDSGAQNTIANSTLRRMLAARRRAGDLGLHVDVLSVTGGRTDGEFLVLPRAVLGGVTVYNLPVAFADLHTFAQFDLADRPAMLLGMDVLRHFDRVSVNFPRREVSFHVHAS